MAEDPSELLEGKAQYNVKFANQLSYNHNNGINFIVSFEKVNGHLQQSLKKCYYYEII